MTAPTPALVTSTCIGCGQNDSDPKHVVVIDDAHNSVAWHMDCHSRATTPCPVCTTQLTGYTGTTPGDLRNHLIGL